VDYQNGTITSLQLQHQRFNSWAERLSVPPGELNDAFMNAMAEICSPLPGAVSLLNALQGKVKMGIITNGFTSLQQIRLERTGLRDHFDLLIISEEVGVAKPDAHFRIRAGAGGSSRSFPRTDGRRYGGVRYSRRGECRPGHLLAERPSA
jgi:FMN phosphatase YigB (HAD superfamily)